MADETKPAIGMSVGATTLAAVTADRSITRRPVLTLYPDRSSKVGVPTENPDIGDPGLVITDFVNQVGAAQPVLAADGSAHRGEQLLADALRALAYGATEGRPLPPAVAVSYPAHWAATAVDALHAALSRAPEWTHNPIVVISDVNAALTALQANPGLPDEGVIAVCDFGGSGTSITLVDAAEHHVIGATVRHTGFSGALIDQALLDHVVAELSAEGTVGGALAIGSLARLRDQCRAIKEQLSINTVVELPVDVPGFHGGVWLTRAELDEAIRKPFAGFLAAALKAMEHGGVQPESLAAIVTVGGGANIPAITTWLSQRLGAVVVSSPRPQLTSAIGAALRVARAPAVAAATTPAPRESVAHPAPLSRFDAPPIPGRDTAPPGPPAPPSPPRPPSTPMPPRPAPQSFPGTAGRLPWYRRPATVIVAVVVAVLIAGSLAVVALRHAADSAPAPSTVISTPPVPPTAPMPSTAGPEGTLPDAPETPGTLDEPS